MLVIGFHLADRWTPRCKLNDESQQTKDDNAQLAHAVTVDTILPWLLEALAPFPEARAAVVRMADLVQGRTGDGP